MYMYGLNHETNMSSVFASGTLVMRYQKIRCKPFGPRSGPNKTWGPYLDTICLAFFEKVNYFEINRPVNCLARLKKV